MKFAFILMGDFNPKQDISTMHGGMIQTIGVSGLDEAAEIAKDLYESGVECIELCGAFGEEGAKKVIAATQNKIPIGYVTHLSEQDEIYRVVFPENA